MGTSSKSEIRENAASPVRSAASLLLKSSNQYVTNMLK